MKIKVLNALFFTFLMLLSQVVFAQKPDLGTASNFTLFTSNGTIDNVGSTNITGYVGTHSGNYKGFTAGTIAGQMHQADSITAQVAMDLDEAYNHMNNWICRTDIGSSLGNNQTLTPNVYCIGSSATLNGFLTLDAQNNPDAVFIFKIEGGLTTSTISNIVLINGASLDNVFWQVKGATVLGKNSVFKGTLVANDNITLLENASLLGRGLTRKGAISLHNNYCAVLVPINLVYFTAQKQDNAVLLNWSTASEKDIVRIELQRSYNARDFETLTTFISMGKVNEKMAYVFTDKSPFDVLENPTSNIVYYRVKQVDINNTFVYSKTISVSKETTGVVSGYPIPTSYQITMKSVSDVKPFFITDISGKIVGSGQYTASNALDLSHLPAGYYSLNIQSMNIRFLKN